MSLFSKTGADEGFGLGRDEAVAIGAQASHAGGSPCNQRECAGFNWPCFSVGAGNPVALRPMSASWLPCASGKPHLFARGVLHAATSATVFLLLSVLPASL